MTSNVNRRFKAGLIAFALLLAQVVLPVQSAFATDQNGQEHHADSKVFVCKYVGTPGVDERLKEGKNPISVSSDAEVGSYFNDGQERSFVLAVDNTSPGPEDDPQASACPNGDSGHGRITTPVITSTIVCGPNNDNYTVPTNVNYSIVNNQNGTYTLTAASGYIFTTSNSNTVTLTVPKDNDTICPTPKLCPVPFSTIHSTNKTPVGWNVPAEAEYVDGGIKLNVGGDWQTTSISRAMVGPLADIGSVVGFDASPSQYVGIHIDTNDGRTLTFEKEPSYEGKWWSESDFGVASGLGYRTLDTLENIVAANPNVLTSQVRVLYTHPQSNSSVITSVTVGCTHYTFDKEDIPAIPVKVCSAVLPLITSTNKSKKGWTVPSDAEYVSGGIKLNVSGNWDETYISRAMVGPLADIGTKVDFTSNPNQYTGIHIVTSKGVLVYEKEGTYGGKWWSTSDFGVDSGLGYNTFDTLENIVAANPDVTTSELRVLYTNPDVSSTEVTSVTVGCATYVFDKEIAAEVPTKCTVHDNLYLAPWKFDDDQYPAADGGAMYAFNKDGLYLSTPVQNSEVYGLIDAGKTAIRDIDEMSYTTYRDASSTGNPQVVTAYVLYVDLDGNLATDDGTYLFYEPIYNGTVQTGVWQTWNVDAPNAVFWSTELSGGNPTLTWSEIVAAYPDAVATSYGFNQGTYNEGTNARLDSLKFACATTSFVKPGQGGGTPPITPPVTPSVPATPTVPVEKTPVAALSSNAAAALPAELPMTGSNGSILTTWVTLLAAVLTYGAVYYLQPKKRMDQ